ncbi:MAG: hypothetical protein RIG62_22380 [Cyclobacteriaceae bacterium]
MKWLKNIEDFTEHILSNKERATKRHLNHAKAEIPREVFDRVCQLIADELTTIGFSYFPSRHKLALESADKKYSLLLKFSSNRDNVAGQYIELSAMCYIESKDLKKFSKTNPLLNYWNETMIGRDIGALVDGGEGTLIWNLADKKEYDNAVSVIPKATKGRLLKLFEDLQNPGLIVDEIEKGNFELNNPMTTVQYLLMVSRQDVAEKYLSAFLSRPPKKILEDYQKVKISFENGEASKEFIHGMGYGHEIALLEKAYNLKIKVPDTV